jgi:hypothetical protein
MRTYLDKEKKCVCSVSHYSCGVKIDLVLIDLVKDINYKVTLQEFLSERFEEVI